jgi:hypothetical protein
LIVEVADHPSTPSVAAFSAADQLALLDPLLLDLRSAIEQRVQDFLHARLEDVTRRR